MPLNEFVRGTLCIQELRLEAREWFQEICMFCGEDQCFQFRRKNDNARIYRDGATPFSLFLSSVQNLEIADIGFRLVALNVYSKCQNMCNLFVASGNKRGRRVKMEVAEVPLLSTIRNSF